MNFSELTDQQLVEVFDSMSADLFANLRNLARVSLELKRRKLQRVEHRQGILAHFELIAAGKLTVEAAFAFAGYRKLLLAISTLPPDEQGKLARGSKVPVAFFTEAGRPAMTGKPPLHLDAFEVELAFCEHGYRQPSKQFAMLKARGHDVRRSVKHDDWRADTSTGELVCGKARLDPSSPAVISALHALGFQIVRLTRKRAA